MKHLRNAQILFLAAAAVVFVLAVFTKLHVLPGSLFNVTVGGLHRIADTFLFFSVALGLTWLALKKE